MTNPDDTVDDMVQDLVAELLHLSETCPAVMTQDRWEPYRSAMTRAAGWIKSAEILKSYESPEGVDSRRPKD